MLYIERASECFSTAKGNKAEHTQYSTLHVESSRTEKSFRFLRLIRNCTERWKEANERFTGGVMTDM